MPVYDRGYTNWEPSTERAWPAWWVIAKRGISEPLKRRWLLMLVLLSWTPAIGKGVVIYIKLKAGDLADLLGGGWASIEPSGFLSFLEMQRFFVFAILAIIGAGLIATDRRDNGLSLYFSRPLGLRSYVGGKAAIIMFYYFMVTLFPALALCLYSYWIAPDAHAMELLLFTPLRLLVFCISTGLAISLVLLAFSSLGTRSIFVMVWWTIMVMGTELIATFSGLFNQGAIEIVNFLGQYHNAGSLLFGSEARLDIHPVVSLVAALAWTVAAILILRWRIRPVEVVS
jgi:hypothetical protein